MPMETTGPARVELSAAKLALIEARLRGRSRSVDIARRDHGSTVPLSSAQERLYFLDRLQPGMATYNIAEAVRLSDVDEGALERALGEVFRRHDALRTIFHETDGVPAGRVARFTGFRLPLEDLSGMDEDAREAEALDRFARENAYVFDLGTGPLFRATLLRLGAGEHVLILCMHHIVGDGWSTRILFGEMWALYAAFREGRPSPLPELEVQYADYAAWQRERAGSEAEARRLRYWRERLAGVPEVLDLPADHPRPTVPTHRGATVPVGVPLAVAELLRALARTEGTTLYAVVLAAWKALLAQYAGTDDVVVGGVTAGRTRREVEGLIGLFVNTLVLRTDLSGDPSFREAVGQVRECLLGAYEHQELPFERLVAELRPERTLNQSPLVQVMYQLNHAAEEAPSAGEPVAGLSLELAETVANFDLTLDLQAHAGGLSGTLGYATESFEPATALRMAGHLERMLAQAAADPDRRLSRLELMDAAERKGVVDEWNRTGMETAARCIHDLFQERARMDPGAVAVVFRDEEITYGELDARADRLAHRLAALGAAPEARIGVCLERSAHWFVALLGVLKAGASYVPLDPAYPPDRLAFMLEDCGASMLVTQASLRHRLPGGTSAVLVDGYAEAGASMPGGAPRTRVLPDNAAYVIYTSGSTGLPKGVQVSHASAANLFAGMAAHLDGGEPGTWLAQASIGFDIHVLEMLWTLTAGFRVVLLPDLERAGRGETPAALLRRHAVTHFQCTPSLAALVVAEAGVEAFAGLRRLLLGGEALPADLAARIAEAHPGTLLNVYGPTETTVWSVVHPVTGGERGVPVGRPLANQRAYVLDAALRPTPVAVPGELYIGGRGVSRGYLDRPGLTAARFVPDPFSGEAGARLYRTGDRARWRGDALLECLGRADEQVKVRGFRIEPGEIEAALRTHPAVRDCAVVAREDRPGHVRLAAYVVAGAEGVVGEALRTHLLERLPRQMVPDAFVLLPALPLSPSGKLDRRALPAPEAHHAGDVLGRGGRDRGAAEGPADEVEAALIAIWEELLGMEEIGPGDSFFDLGGSSGLALRLFARVNARLDCDLPVSTLFNGGTLRQVAEAVREQKRGRAGSDSPVVPLQAGGALPPLYLVHTAGGEVMHYMNVVRLLGPDQPVYGLQDTSDDFARPLVCVAAEYVEAVRAAQPQGPYYLAGWSYGGSVAFEMAIQLEALSQAVAFVGLIDTMSPDLLDVGPTGDADIVAGLAREMAEEAGQVLHIPPDSLAELDRDAQIRLVFQELQARGLVPEGTDEAALAASCKINRDRNASRKGYVGGRFPGTLTLFRALDVPDHVQAWMASRSDGDRHVLGWEPFSARPVEVYPIPGNHNTIAAEPHVRALVESMRVALATARRRAVADSLPS